MASVAPQRGAVPAPAPIDSRLRRGALVTFALTWCSYATYYLARKNFSVVKSRLEAVEGLSRADLGTIDTGYLCCYALGQLLSGALGDRIGARWLIGAGMLLSALCTGLFGLGHGLCAFALLFGLNGLFQATGWPGNVKAMQPWISDARRGRVMGLWCTSYQVGGFLATAVATAALVRSGWRAAFLIPAVVVGAMGCLVLLFLPRPPRPVVDGPADGASLRALLRLPALWRLGGAYFGLKLIRYSLLFWLPYFLKTELRYDDGTAGYVSIALEAGGVLGAVGVGALADRLPTGSRARLAAPLLFALAGACLLLRSFAHSGVPANLLTLGLCGFLLIGPDSLISAAAAQDLGGDRATGTVSGLINSFGSLGAILQGSLTVVITTRLGWSALFHLFVVIALLSGTLLLLPAARRSRQAPYP